MPEVDIVKLKIRRGSDSQRSITVLEQGELGYTNDYKRLWIGDGQIAGGTVVGNIVHDTDIPRASITTATKGDIVYEQGKLYRLASSSPLIEENWEFIGTKTDAAFIEYNAQDEITLKDSSITKAQINSDIVLSTGGINFNQADGLSINVDNITIENSNNSLQLKEDSIDEAYIKSSTVTNGLTGGGGEPIGLSINENLLEINNNQLSIVDIPIGVVNTESLSADFVGRGLNINNNSLEATLHAVDTTYLTVSSVQQPNQTFLETITLKSKFIGNTQAQFYENITFDKLGRLEGKSSALGISLSADNTTTTWVSGGVDVPFLSGAFNGSLDQNIYTDQTIIDTLSTVGASTYVASLTSAGFIQLDMGGSIGVVAIPVFLPPSS